MFSQSTGGKVILSLFKLSYLFIDVKVFSYSAYYAMFVVRWERLEIRKCVVPTLVLMFSQLPQGLYIYGDIRTTMNAIREFLMPS